MSTPATIADTMRFLAVRDLRESHRLALRSYGDLKRTGAPADTLAELGQAAHRLGRALAAIAESDRLRAERPHKARFPPMTDAEKRQQAEARILERLRLGPEKTTLLAQYAGRNGIGYDVARRVMNDMKLRGSIRCAASNGHGGPVIWTLGRSALA